MSLVLLCMVGDFAQTAFPRAWPLIISVNRVGPAPIAWACCLKSIHQYSPFTCGAAFSVLGT